MDLSTEKLPKYTLIVEQNDSTLEHIALKAQKIRKDLKKKKKKKNQI
jgi:hypothetical protein